MLWKLSSAMQLHRKASLLSLSEAPLPWDYRGPSTQEAFLSLSWDISPENARNVPLCKDITFIA